MIGAFVDDAVQNDVVKLVSIRHVARQLELAALFDTLQEEKLLKYDFVQGAVDACRCALLVGRRFSGVSFIFEKLNDMLRKKKLGFRKYLFHQLGN